MQELGRILVGLGILLALAGGLVLVLARSGMPLGSLPGDFAFRGKSFSFFAPLGTCLLLSVALSLVLYLFVRLRR